MFAEKPQLQEKPYRKALQKSLTEKPYRKALPARKPPQPFEFLELENGVDFQGKLHWPHSGWIGLHSGIPG